MSSNDTEEQGATAYSPTNICSTLLAKAEIKTFLFMTFNLVSSPALIFVNKSIFHYYHFNFATALTCFHFACTGLGLFICSKVGLFEPKTISISELLPLIFCNAVCTPLANVSMQLNSLGFYQVMKIAITPCVVAMEFFVFGKTLDRRLAMCLVPVCMGVAICTVTDMEVRMVGAVVGSLMTLSTVFVQVVFKTFQEKHKVDSMQLLFYVMPLSCVAQFGTIPLAEDVPALKSFEWTHSFTMFIMLSGFLAFCVNLSGFLVIGKATPVTYNVVTHCKTVVVIVGGFVLFDSPLAAKNVMGIVLTLIGAWGYAYFKLTAPTDGQQAKKDDKAEADIETADPPKK